MNKEIKSFIKICKKDQYPLKSFLFNKLKEYGYSPKAGDGYLLAVGSKVLLTAHMDTVHKDLVKNVTIEKHKGETIISSKQGIGGDDRCGIYMILSLLERGYRPTVLFCEDEEIGGVGSEKFTKSDDAEILNDMLYLIELDRANADDAVYYSCGNKEFQEYVESFGFKKATGSFSDISHLSPEADVASVNLSCGYYKAHTTDEYVVFEEMLVTIDKVALMLDKEEELEGKFDYQEVIYSTWGFNRYSGYSRDDWYDDYYGYPNYYASKYFALGYIHEAVPDVLTVAEYSCRNEYEAIGKFMKEHPDMTLNEIVEICDGDALWDMYDQDEIVYEDELAYYLRESEEEMEDEFDEVNDDIPWANEDVIDNGKGRFKLVSSM